MTAASDQPNERQQRFVDEYLKDPNATHAALRRHLNAADWRARR